ncbi:MAG: HAD-IIB family hydrolase [Bacilli bacterium]|nr:HAD-IIB family hydrolase [Bacilli bacterium]
MKVIASDFDNTLYVKDEKGLQENIQAVRDFISKGNIFIIITGRSFTNIKKVLNEYDIPYSYLVCQDGANLFDKDDNCMKRNALDIEKARKIEEYMKENNLAYNFESAFNDEDTIDHATKITITVSNMEEALSKTEDIKKIADVYAYVSSKHINIIDSYVNKCSALEYLTENYYISNDITVLGDDINDYEMLERYYGLVMKKHHEILDPLNKETINSVGEYLNSIME